MDAPAPRPNKRPRADGPPAPAPDTKKARTAPADADAPISKRDAELAEFMQTMQPRSKRGPAWANDGPVAPPAGPDAKKGKKAKRVTETDAVPEDEEWGGIGAAGTESEVEPEPEQQGMSDLDWMRRRMSTGVDTAGKAFVQSDDEDDAPSSQPAGADAAVCSSFAVFPRPRNPNDDVGCA
jgi:multiple RNA-binding domain-containing protein 1